MTFYAGGRGVRGAKTCILVHFSSPAYEQHICSATCRRNISSKVDLSMNINTTSSLLPNCWKFFSLGYLIFQMWAQTQKAHFVGFSRNFLKCGPIHIRKVRRSADRRPYWYRSRIVSRVQKVDCACFRHIFTSVFQEMGHFECFFIYYARIGTVQGVNTVLCDGKSRRRPMDGSITFWFPSKHLWKFV